MTEPEGARAALPRADGRLDADRAAAGEQRRPRRDPGARRRCAAARSRCTRTRSTRRSRCPSERAARIALRTQQVLAHEAGVTDTADPLGGSYYVEALTDELEARAWELIERVDELGGAVAAIEQGFVQGEIEAAAYAWTRAVEAGERSIVGVNAFVEEASERDRAAPDRPGGRAAPGRADARACAPGATRPRRSGRSRACARPRAGRRTCSRRCATRSRALCTVGEVCGVLREEWGTTTDALRAPAAATYGQAVADPARLADVPGAGRPRPRRLRRADGARAPRARARARARRARPARRREAALPRAAAAGARGAPARRRLGALPRPVRADRASSVDAPLVVTAHGRDVRNVGAIPGIAALTRRVVRRASDGDRRLRLPPPRARDEAARGARQDRGRRLGRRPRALPARSREPRRALGRERPGVRRASAA